MTLDGANQRKKFFTPFYQLRLREMRSLSAGVRVSEPDKTRGINISGRDAREHDAEICRNYFRDFNFFFHATNLAPASQESMAFVKLCLERKKEDGPRNPSSLPTPAKLLTVAVLAPITGDAAVAGRSGMPAFAPGSASAAVANAARSAGSIRVAAGC